MLVGFLGKNEDFSWANWEEPHFISGLCRNVIGWTVNKGDCVELNDPYHPGKWTGKNHMDETIDWDRFFDCPVQHLAVKLTRVQESGKKKYKTVKCCRLLPA